VPSVRAAERDGAPDDRATDRGVDRPQHPREELTVPDKPPHMTSPGFDRMLAAARRRVAAMDEADGGVPGGTLPNIAFVALRSGILSATWREDGLLFGAGDLGCLFDALVYLEQLRAGRN
jgi:hypothetical protein